MAVKRVWHLASRLPSGDRFLGLLLRSVIRGYGPPLVSAHVERVRLRGIDHREHGICILLGCTVAC